MKGTGFATLLSSSQAISYATFAPSKKELIVEGRSLLSYVAVTDPGMSATDLARVFGMTHSPQ
jgi:hypothetical protein